MEVAGEQHLLRSRSAGFHVWSHAAPALEQFPWAACPALLASWGCWHCCSTLVISVYFSTLGGQQENTFYILRTALPDRLCSSIFEVLVTQFLFYSSAFSFPTHNQTWKRLKYIQKARHSILFSLDFSLWLESLIVRSALQAALCLNLWWLPSGILLSLYPVWLLRGTQCRS